MRLILFHTHSDFPCARIVRRRLIHLIQEIDELVLGDLAADLAGLSHADEQVGDLSRLLRLDQANSRD